MVTGCRNADELTYYSPIEVDGERQWASYRNLADDDSDFELVGQDFARTGADTEGAVGAGAARLMSSRALVDYAVDWMHSNRS